jgi:hypothetical protein
MHGDGIAEIRRVLSTEALHEVMLTLAMADFAEMPIAFL